MAWTLTQCIMAVNWNAPACTVSSSGPIDKAPAVMHHRAHLRQQLAERRIGGSMDRVRQIPRQLIQFARQEHGAVAALLCQFRRFLEIRRRVHLPRTRREHHRLRARIEKTLQRRFERVCHRHVLQRKIPLQQFVRPVRFLCAGSLPAPANFGKASWPRRVNWGCCRMALSFAAEFPIWFPCINVLICSC